MNPQITQIDADYKKEEKSVYPHPGGMAFGFHGAGITQENELAAKKRKKGRNLIRRLRRVHGLMMRDQKTYAIIGAAMEVQSAD